jgi:hypothetical protein
VADTQRILNGFISNGHIMSMTVLTDENIEAAAAPGEREEEAIFLDGSGELLRAKRAFFSENGDHDAEDA